MVFLFPVLMKMLLSHLAPFASRSQKGICGFYTEKSHNPNSRHFPRNLNFGPRTAPCQVPLGQGQSLHFLGASWLWENMCSLVSGPEMGWRWSRGWPAAEVRTLPLLKLWSSKQPFGNACQLSPVTVSWATQSHWQGLPCKMQQAWAFLGCLLMNLLEFKELHFSLSFSLSLRIWRFGKNF